MESQKSKPDCPFFIGQSKSPMQRKSHPWGTCVMTAWRRWMNQKGWRRRKVLSLSPLSKPAFSGYTQWIHLPLQILIHSTGFLCRLFLCFTTLFMTLIITCTFIYCSLSFLENKTKPQTKEHIHPKNRPTKQNTLNKPTKQKTQTYLSFSTTLTTTK